MKEILLLISMPIFAGAITFVVNKLMEKSAKKQVEGIKKLSISAKESYSEEDFDLSDITESEKLKSRHFVTEFTLAVERKHEAICLLNPKYDCKICNFVDNMLDSDIYALVSYCKDNYPTHVHRHIIGAYKECMMYNRGVDSTSIQNLLCGREALEYFLESEILLHLEKNEEIYDETKDELKRFVKLAVNYLN